MAPYWIHSPERARNQLSNGPNISRRVSRSSSGGDFWVMRPHMPGDVRLEAGGDNIEPLPFPLGLAPPAVASRHHAGAVRGVFG